MKKKIAFVYHPAAADLCRLETMPFALNSLVALANIGWDVDLYLWEEPSSTYNTILPSNVTIKFFKQKFNRLRPTVLFFRFFWRNNYICVFGISQIGAYIARIISQASKCPLIYFNDEFPSHYKANNFWTILETRSAKEAAVIVLPDAQRIPILKKELDDTSAKPYISLPNIPIIHSIDRNINWHQKLGLPDHSIPFLHAGSLTDWAQVPEILSSVPYWPDKAVLVLHSRLQPELEEARRRFSHLDVPGKVFWSSQRLTVNDFHSLVSYCAGNFALYRNEDPNLEYVGFSSGKLMRSLACGSPVIASNLKSLSFVAEHQLGILVKHPAEIPDAVKKLMKDQGGYTDRCLGFCADIVSFQKYWEKFCDQVLQTTNIDLSQPH
jgi:glycosyltransferase involved in cell wall biosynthesis